MAKGRKFFINLLATSLFFTSGFSMEERLFEACEKNEEDCVKEIVDNYPEINPNGRVEHSGGRATLLYKAVDCKQLKILQSLLRLKKISPNVGFTSDHGCHFSPLHLACYSKNKDFVRELLKHEKIDPNIGFVDSRGTRIPPLIFACIGDDYEILFDLIRFGVDQPKESYDNPFFVAAYSVSRIKFILEHFLHVAAYRLGLRGVKFYLESGYDKKKIVKIPKGYLGNKEALLGCAVELLRHRIKEDGISDENRIKGEEILDFFFKEIKNSLNESQKNGNLVDCCFVFLADF